MPGGSVCRNQPEPSASERAVLDVAPSLFLQQLGISAAAGCELLQIVWQQAAAGNAVIVTLLLAAAAAPSKQDFQQPL